MKYVLTLLLGIGSVSAAACHTSAHKAEVRAATVQLRITGMT